MNAKFVEPCIRKAKKCTKPYNCQNLNIGYFILKMVSVKYQNFSVRGYSEYKEIYKIFSIEEIAAMVFLVEETFTKLHFCPWGPLCIPQSPL